ncbi:MAG: hypothetical protein JWO31_3281 [Phycisphaerales bacterium]|nr:hypothetical protein [Phycisphaerales bacterium]
MAAGVFVTGDKETRRMFAELPKRAVNKALRASVVAAATPVMQTVKQTAPEESGLLAKSIAKKIWSKKGSHAAIIGARADRSGTYRGRKRVPYKYIALVAQGTEPHDLSKKAVRKKGKVSGHQAGAGTGMHPGAKPNPFLRDALDVNRAKVQKIQATKLRDSLEHEAAKLGSR